MNQTLGSGSSLLWQGDPRLPPLFPTSQEVTLVTHSPQSSPFPSKCNFGLPVRIPNPVCFPRVASSPDTLALVYYPEAQLESCCGQSGHYQNVNESEVRKMHPKVTGCAPVCSCSNSKR